MAGLVLRCQQVPAGAPGGATGSAGSGCATGDVGVQAPRWVRAASERVETRRNSGLVMPIDTRSRWAICLLRRLV